MPTVEELSRDDVLVRKEELLRRVGLSEEELRDRADTYRLTTHEAGVLAEIDGLEFLLNG